MATWIKADVVENQHWTKDLFSLVLSAPVAPFTAGQFTKLGMEIDGKLIQRAYSFVNPPQSKYLEVYATRVADGLMSPRLHALEPGDNVMITQDPAGYFTLDEVPQGQHLWMFATGTAIGPYISLMEQGDVWSRFRKIILVHAVRFAADLTYQARINALAEKYPDQLIVQPFVSREPIAGALSGRVTHALEDGLLERVVGLPLTPEHSQVMLCGNPAMVKEVKTLLEGKGLSKNLRRKPGHVTTEHYW